MAYKIDKNACVNCGTCAGMCPVGAIRMVDGKYKIDPSKCVGCGMCANICPMNAIKKAEAKQENT